MRYVLLGCLLVNVAVCSADLKFNALDKSDLHYAEFNANLCRYTAEYSERMDSKLRRMVMQFPALKSSDERNEWMNEFSVAASLKNQFDDDFATYCEHKN